MKYTDDEHYYALLMSDDIVLGKGEYVRGQNISQETISYKNAHLIAKGLMRLDNDELYLKLEYQLSDSLTLEFVRENQQESVTLKSSQKELIEMNVTEKNYLIESINIDAFNMVLHKNAKTLLLNF